jgi:D-arabinose 5-phosphate isomerase GutQ
MQNSNVLLFNGKTSPHTLPACPPTPSESPAASVYESVDPLDLTGAKTLDHEERLKKERVADGVRVLTTQADALYSLVALYETHALAQQGFHRAVEAIVNRRQQHGKLVICGVGKSGYIGRKLVATFQSLGVFAAFLHPTEALHGDLGYVGVHDTFMFITFSGKTSELLAVVSHLPDTIQLVVLTASLRREECELLRDRPTGILLPAPVHMTEVESFGVAAPTTSTTAALAVGDALAMAVANDLHQDMVAVFARNHPGGAIGAALKLSRPEKDTVQDIATPWDCIPVLEDDALGLDLLRAGFGSTVGWVRLHAEGIAMPSRIRRLSGTDLVRPARHISGLMIREEDMICVPGEMSTKEAEAAVQNMLIANGGTQDVILAVKRCEEIIGVLEASQVMPAHHM